MAHGVYGAFKDMEPFRRRTGRHIETVPLVAPRTVHAETAKCSPQGSKSRFTLFIMTYKHDITALVLIYFTAVQQFSHNPIVNTTFLAKVII